MLRVLDTFAGAGGFSLGFQLAGFEIVGAIEQDQWAADTFQHNHPNAEVFVSDIETLSESTLLKRFKSKSPDIVLGGPPCQGFSVCRRDAGDPTDPRNSLFEEFIRICATFAPKYVVMENVPNLVKARTQTGQRVVDIILEELKTLGYDSKCDILESTSFGVPQIRKRLIIVGTRGKLTNYFPLPTHTTNPADQNTLFYGKQTTCPTLWDAISDLPDIEAREGSDEMPYSAKPLNGYQKMLRQDSKVLYNHIAMKHSARMVERFASMKWGESVADVPDELKPFKRNSNGSIITKGYDQNNRRLHPDRPSHTIPASFYANFVHPYKNRNFTPREGARLQSFPDWYRFLGKPTVVSHKLLAREGRNEEKHLCQYSQIGNAVPPLLAKAIATNILKNEEAD